MKNITVPLVLGWAFGVLICLVGLGLIFSNFAVGFITLIIGIFFLPVTGKFIEKKWGLKLSGGIKVLVVVILLGVGIAISSSAKDAKEKSQFATALEQTKETQVFDIPKVVSVITEDELKKPEYAPFLGTLESENKATKADLETDPNATSDITFEKNGKELLVEYDPETKTILDYFVGDTNGGTKDIAGLYKIAGVAKDSTAYTVKENVSLKDPTIYTGILITPIRVERFSDTQLRREAQEIMTKTLKSPSTAKFNDYGTVKRLANNCFRISSNVDSQNGLGAMLTTDYEVTLCHLGGDNIDPYDSPVELQKIVADGKTVFSK